MIDLFILETCPYCRKVTDYLSETEIDYRKLDIKNPDNALRLLTLGAKEQVPFLYNEETNDKLYESEDIIKYLKNLKQE